MRAFAISLLVASGFAAAQTAPIPLVPNPALTPGVADPAVTQDNIDTTICLHGYTAKVRHTSASLKSAVYREYGVDPKSVHAEVDHRLPLEVGGADVQSNLWIQDYDSHPYNAHLKDHLENYLHRAVCSGKMSLQQGRAIFLGDWTQAYDQIFGKPVWPISSTKSPAP